MSSVVVHFAQHKVGTLLLGRVLRQVARGLDPETGLPRSFEKIHNAARAAAPLAPGSVCLYLHGRYSDFLELEARWGRALTASRMIRDPRDVIVSGYHYHRRGAEPWCRSPRPELGGRSYAERLEELDEEGGLLFEMDHAAKRTILALAEWPPDEARVHVVRFEDVIGDFDHSIRTLLGHYGFGQEAREELLTRLRRHDLARMSDGSLRRQPHISGRNPVGRWRAHFTPRLKQAFRELYPGALARLGYERGNAW